MSFYTGADFLPGEKAAGITDRPPFSKNNLLGLLILELAPIGA